MGWINMSNLLNKYYSTQLKYINLQTKIDSMIN